MSDNNKPTHLYCSLPIKNSHLHGKTKFFGDSPANHPYLYPPNNKDPVIIHEDDGGDIGDYLLQTVLYQESGQEVRILGNAYSAAAAMPLQLDNQLCVARNATLNFHAIYACNPSKDAPPGKGIPVIVKDSTDVIYDGFPEKLRKTLAGMPHYKELKFQTIKGDRLIDEFGIRECPKDGVDVRPFSKAFDP